MCPIIGARRLDQLSDIERLNASTEADLGFPGAFIRDNGPWVFGPAALAGD